MKGTVPQQVEANPKHSPQILAETVLPQAHPATAHSHENIRLVPRPVHGSVGFETIKAQKTDLPFKRERKGLSGGAGRS